MKKKNYIEPSAIVREIRLDEFLQVGGSGDTDHELPGYGGEAGDDDGSDARHYNGSHDIWED